MTDPEGVLATTAFRMGLVPVGGAFVCLIDSDGVYVATKLGGEYLDRGLPEGIMAELLKERRALRAERGFDREASSAGG